MSRESPVDAAAEARQRESDGLEPGGRERSPWSAAVSRLYRALPLPAHLRSRFGGIGPRLVVRVVLFSSAVTLVLTTLQLYFDYSRDVHVINVRLEEIGRSNLGSIGQALWSVDESQLTLQLEGILRLPHIRAAEVRETTRVQNPITIAVGERGTAAVLSREFPIIYSVRGDEQKIGSLYVEATLTEVYQSLFDKALIILVSQGAKTFVVTFFIVYIFYRLVTRHLSSIAAFVTRYRLDQPGQALVLDRQPPDEPDELDEVAAAFNSMASRLQRTYEQLRAANDQLGIDNRALTEAEAALRTSEQRFRDYTETASDWLWESGPDHAFTYFSDELGRFGLNRDELLGGYRWDRAADLESEPEKWQAHRAALDRHEPFRSLNYCYRSTDGSLRYVTTSGKPFFDDAGRFLGYRGTARDITARSLAEARVRELSSAVEQSPAGIAVVEPGGRLIYSNLELLQISGLTEAEGEAAMTDILPLEEWQRLVAAAERGETVHQEVLARRMTGDSFWGLLSVAAIRTTNGGKQRLVVALQDITREKAEQQEREALLERLQQTGKMEAIGRLAGGIAHDFNNLLGAMMGFSHFLVEDLPKDTESHKYAERIVRMCEKGRDMVEQLLAFARARDIERNVIDMVLVVERCRDLLEASLPSSSRLEIEPGEEALPVLGNKTQLQQVLLNLCLNARDALDGAPGRITVRLTRFRREAAPDDEPEAARVSPLKAGCDYVLLTVSDTGAGMDAATVAQVFEPFFTTKGLGRGTGLGLAVVHGIVTSHSGIIDVKSAPGKGTTFEIYLPMADELPTPEGTAKPVQEYVRGHERVMVVDDDPDLVQALTIGLNRYGYEVLSLTNPVKALLIFNDMPERWDLVVSDQVMPGMMGIELIAALKRQRPTLQAILYTGFDEGISESVAAQQGVDLLLHKPITPQVLAGRIRRLLAERRQP